MKFLLIPLIAIWLFSIFAFAKWRIRSKTQNGDISISVLNDEVTNAYVMVTATILLVLIFFLI